jgi:hypothetical protein
MGKDHVAPRHHRKIDGVDRERGSVSERDHETATVGLLPESPRPLGDAPARDDQQIRPGRRERRAFRAEARRGPAQGVREGARLPLVVGLAVGERPDARRCRVLARAASDEVMAVVGEVAAACREQLPAHVRMPDGGRLEMRSPPVRRERRPGRRIEESTARRRLTAHRGEHEAPRALEQRRDDPRDVPDRQALEPVHADDALAVRPPIPSVGEPLEQPHPPLDVEAEASGMRLGLAAQVGQQLDEAPPLRLADQGLDGLRDLPGCADPARQLAARDPLEARAPRGEPLARRIPAEELEAAGDRLSLEVVPQCGVGALLIDEALGKRSPGLGVQGRVVQQVALARDELLVARVPAGREIAAETRRLRGLAQERALPGVPGLVEGPDRGHPLAVDQHDRGFGVRDREMACGPEIEIEEPTGVGQVDLVLVVVDRAATAEGQGGDREAVVREARRPAAAIEAFELRHEVDAHLAAGSRTFSIE